MGSTPLDTAPGAETHCSGELTAPAFRRTSDAAITPLRCLVAFHHGSASDALRGCAASGPQRTFPNRNGCARAMETRGRGFSEKAPCAVRRGVENDRDPRGLPRLPLGQRTRSTLLESRLHAHVRRI